MSTEPVPGATPLAVGKGLAHYEGFRYVNGLYLVSEASSRTLKSYIVRATENVGAS